MRTIKFRAWTGKELLLSADDDPNYITGNGFKTLWYRPLSALRGDSNDYVWMQFTGLLDKNGKEIYEDDLVKSSAHNPDIYRIEFLEGSFCATNPKLEGYPIDINHFYDSTGCAIEVIGNMYETPNKI